MKLKALAILVCLILTVSYAGALQDNTSNTIRDTSKSIEFQSIKESIARYYNALCTLNREEAIASWSNQSPGYATRIQGIDYYIKVTQLSIQKMQFTDLKLSGETASVRLVLDQTNTLVFPARKRAVNHEVRVISLIKTGDRWLLMGSSSPVSELATMLAGANPSSWNKMLLGADKDLITLSLMSALRALSLSCVKRGDYTTGNNAVQASIVVAKQLNNSQEAWNTIKQYAGACNDNSNLAPANELLNSIKSAAIAQNRPIDIAEVDLVRCEYTGDPNTASSLAKEAEQLFTQEHSKVGVSRAREAQGVIYLRQREFVKGIKQLELSLDGCPTVLAPVIWLNIGHAYMDRHLADQALKAYSHSIGFLNKNPDADTEAEVCNKQGIVYLEQGDLDRAQKAFQRSLSLYERLGSTSDQGRLHSNLGDIFYFHGQYKEATEEYDKARPLLRGPNDKDDLARVSLNAGHMAASFHHYAEAITAADQSFQLGDSEMRGAALALKGSVFKFQGDYNRAKSAFNDSLKLAEASNDPVRIAEAKNNLGILAMSVRDFEAARGFLDSARELLQPIHAQFFLGRTLRNLGIVYKELDSPRARGCIEESLRIAKDLSDKTGRADAEFSLGNLDYDAGRIVEAGTDYESARALSETTGDMLMLFYSTWHIGRVLWKRDQFDEAIANYRRSTDILNDIRQQINRQDVQQVCFLQEGDKSIVFSEFAQLLILRHRPDEASKVVQKIHCKSVIDSLRETSATDDNVQLRQWLDSLTGLEEALTSQQKVRTIEASKKQSEQNPILLANASLEIASTWKKLRDLQSKLNRANVDFQKRISIEIPSLKELQQNLRKDEIAVEYVPMVDSLLVFVVSHRPNLPDDAQFFGYVVPVTQTKLSALVSGCIASMRNPFVNETGERRTGTKQWDWKSPEAEPLKHLLTELYAYLISPIRSEIDKANAMRIIPSGDLRNIPFQALAYQKTDGALRFLGQDILPTIQSRRQKQECGDRLDRSGKEIDNLAIFANPRGKRLGTQQEGDALNRMYVNHSHLYSGSNASLYQLNHVPIGTTCLVVDSEAAVYPNESKSFIEMANDEKLSQDYLSGLHLGVRLTVLSTCQSSYYATDDRLEDSFADRFLEAGSKCVVGSLWKIDDSVTCQWMLTFFGRLHGGIDIAHAKQYAEAQMLSSPATAHPYFWSAFALSGNWR